MVQPPSQNKQTLQFSRDDVSRIIAMAIDTMLEKVSIRQTVEGIAVFPAGEGVLVVDIVMRDLTTQSTWKTTITIPPPKEEVEKRDG